jgi:hypothetical protein
MCVAVENFTDTRIKPAKSANEKALDFQLLFSFVISLLLYHTK